jgi:hypothetical protein
MSGLTLRGRSCWFDQLQRAGRTMLQEASLPSITATTAAQMALQSVVLVGLQPLQGSDPRSEAIHAKPVSGGDGIAVVMKCICTPATSARIMMRAIARRDTTSSTGLL